MYNEAYKRKTVQYVKESGKAVAEVARELKIKDNTLYGWMKKYGGEPEVVEGFVIPGRNICTLIARKSPCCSCNETEAR
ncbi:transposase [Paenibacillus sp. CECT 9249]|uniref:transposase n=1 Tax=Paenibacillus sp. CECT 9249 TaxID=2845385 RepID=UPI0033B5E1AE